jgi:K+ transporter
MRYTWRKPWYLVLSFGIFLVIDSYTWAANATKIPSGGWVAILIATGFFILGFCWFFGEMNLRRFLKIRAQPTSLHKLSARLGFLNNNTHQNFQYSFTDLPIAQTVNGIDFGNESDSNSDSDIAYHANTNRVLPKVQNRILLIKNVPLASSNNIRFHLERTDENTHGTIPVVITPCVGCFLTTSKKHTPHVFENFLAHMHAVPNVIIFLQIEHTKRPTIENNERVIVKAYGENIFHITALYGYSEYQIKPFEILLLARTQYNVPIPEDELKVTLFIPNETIKVSANGWHSWIRRWPLHVYAVLKSIYPGPTTDVDVKTENTVNICIVAKLE